MPDPSTQADDLVSGRLTLDQAAKGQRAAPVTPPPVITPGMEPAAKAPVMTAAPKTDRKFPCKACGAKLDFDPAQRALHCPYCGHVEQIAPAQTRIQEFDFEAYLKKQAGEETALAGRSSEVRCPGCGANVLLEDRVATEKCPFCGTFLENTTPQAAQRQIAPAYLLPFAIAQKDAVAAFNTWIASRWFAPSDLKKLANLGQLAGVYEPFWTYDSMTYTHYTGQRGDDYWVTETYTERDADGRTVTRTRQVRRTRWSYVSGEVDHFFDNILVYASKSLPSDYVERLRPWDFPALEPFRTEFLAGFRTERYSIGLGEGFDIARQVMDKKIRVLCEEDIGGDHQSLQDVATQHVGVTFKHILLPIWLAVYRYNNQTYRILVNARTGEVQGTRPWSWLKITALVLAILAALAVLVLIFLSTRHGGGGGWQ